MKAIARYKPYKGVDPYGTEVKQIAVRMDKAMFLRVQTLAMKKNISFSSMVREILDSAVEVFEDENYS